MGPLNGDRFGRQAQQSVLPRCNRVYDYGQGGMSNREHIARLFLGQYNLQVKLFDSQLILCDALAHPCSSPGRK